jgi:hypothetical protein
MSATFYSQILHWNWPEIVRLTELEATEHVLGDRCSQEYGCDGNAEHGGSTYLGSCFALAPSGKYWHFLAHGNVTMKEAYRDQAFYEALDRVAYKYGGWITRGEGDPCDIYFCRQYTGGDIGIGHCDECERMWSLDDEPDGSVYCGECGNCREHCTCKKEAANGR